MSIISRLAKDSVVYGLGEIFSKFVSFISIIIYTRIFSVSEFGEIEILVIFGSFNKHIKFGNGLNNK